MSHLPLPPYQDTTDGVIPDADTLNRVVKIAVDSGEVPTIDAAYSLLRSYRVGIRVGPELCTSAPHQAALLTIVNIARRALLGGAFIEGDVDAPLLAPLVGFRTLAQAVQRLGGRLVQELPDGAPILLLGSAPRAPDDGSLCLSLRFSDWRGGVVPSTQDPPSQETDAIAPAAILAAAVAVSEVFQHLRGNPMACRRPVGLSLWAPDHLDWENAPAGPVNIVVPSRLWLLGLGHLGQAYLWVLGLLPYRTPAELTLVLQDFDRLKEANDSTSLLTTPKLVGRPKTRAMADWADKRGFNTQIIERPFPGGISVTGDEPRLALGGVDNPQARAAYEDAGFEWIVEAGLGAGPVEYLALRLHTFPATTTARRKWGGATGRGSNIPPVAAYRDLQSRGMDECGIVQLASRSVGAPFVGTVAATLVISEVLRFLNGGRNSEVIDMTLGDPLSRSVVHSSRDLKGFNPGFTMISPTRSLDSRQTTGDGPKISDISVTTLDTQAPCEYDPSTVSSWPQVKAR